MIAISRQEAVYNIAGLSDMGGGSFTAGIAGVEAEGGSLTYGKATH